MSYGQRPPSAGRRRVSKRTYMVRRLVALAFVVLFLWVMVSVFGGMFGGDDSTGEAVDVPPTRNTIVFDPGGTTTLQATTTTEPPVKERTTPSAADPAELLILGDSDAGTFGPYLKTLLDATGIVTTTVDYKVSSGLSRPDFFDWPAQGASAPQQGKPRQASQHGAWLTHL